MVAVNFFSMHKKHTSSLWKPKCEKGKIV